MNRRNLVCIAVVGGALGGAQVELKEIFELKLKLTCFVRLRLSFFIVASDLGFPTGDLRSLRGLVIQMLIICQYNSIAQANHFDPIDQTKI